MGTTLATLLTCFIFLSGVFPSAWLTFTDWSECLEHACGGISYSYEYITYCQDNQGSFWITTDDNRVCFIQTTSLLNRSCTKSVTASPVTTSPVTTSRIPTSPVTPCDNKDVKYPEPLAVTELLPCSSTTENTGYRLGYTVKRENLFRTVRVAFIRNYSAAAICDFPEENSSPEDSSWNSTAVIVGVCVTFFILIVLFGGTSCRLAYKQRNQQRHNQERERRNATQFGLNFNLAIYGQLGRQRRVAFQRQDQSSSRGRGHRYSRRGRSSRVAFPSQSSSTGNRSSSTFSNRNVALPRIIEGENFSEVQSRDSLPPPYEDSNCLSFCVTSAIPSVTTATISVITEAPPPAYDQVFDTGPNLYGPGDHLPPPYHPHNANPDLDAIISHELGYF